MVPLFESEPALALVPALECWVLVGALGYVFVFLLQLDPPVLQTRPSRRSGCRRIAVEAAEKWEDGLVGIRSLSFWEVIGQPAAR